MKIAQQNEANTKIFVGFIWQRRAHAPYKYKRRCVVVTKDF